MVAIYARVSSKEQETNTSLERQEREGVAFAVKQGEPYQSYIEAKSGGSLQGRGEIERLISDVEAGSINKVWVLTPDRLARDADDAAYLLRIMKTKGVAFYAGGKLINPRDYRDFFMFRVEQAVGEMDLAQRAEKTTNGLHDCMDAGELKTRRLYGYRRKHDPDGTVRFEIDKEQEAIIKRIFDMDSKGNSYCRIAFTLTGEKQETPTGVAKWPAPTVRRMLANPHYAGLTYNAARELIRSEIYPAIIDPLTWKRAQRQHVARRVKLYSRQNAHMVSGLLRCAVCHDLYHYSLSSTLLASGKKLRYHNYLHDYHGKRCHGSAKRILLWWVDIVFKIVYLIAIRDTRAISKLYAKETAQIDRQREQIERDVQHIDGKIEELSKEKQRYVLAIGKGSITAEDAGERIRAINKEVTELEKVKVDSHRDLMLKQDRTELLLREFGADSFHRFLGEGGIDDEGKVIREATTDRERRDLLSRIVESATIAGREITIKIVSGKMFTLTYAPRDEEKAVKVLARQAGVDMNLLSEDTLKGLYDAVVRQGADSATAVYVEVMDREGERTRQVAPGRNSGGLGNARGQNRGGRDDEEQEKQGS